MSKISLPPIDRRNSDLILPTFFNNTSSSPPNSPTSPNRISKPKSFNLISIKILLKCIPLLLFLILILIYSSTTIGSKQLNFKNHWEKFKLKQVRTKNYYGRVGPKPPTFDQIAAAGNF